MFVNSFGFQLDMASANTVDQGLLIAEKEVEVASLTMRCSRLAEQLRFTELRIIEMSKPVAHPQTSATSTAAPSPSRPASINTGSTEPQSSASIPSTVKESSRRKRMSRIAAAASGPTATPNPTPASSISSPRKRNPQVSSSQPEPSQEGLTAEGRTGSTVSMSSLSKEEESKVDAVSLDGLPEGRFLSAELESDTSSISGLQWMGSSEDPSSSSALDNTDGREQKTISRVGSETQIGRLSNNSTPQPSPRRTRSTRLQHHISSPSLGFRGSASSSFVWSPSSGLHGLTEGQTDEINNPSETIKLLKENEHHLKKRVKRLSARVLELDHLLEAAKNEAAVSTTIQRDSKDEAANNGIVTEETLLGLVRELTIANRKLEDEVAESKRMLEVAHGEVNHLTEALEEAQNDILLFNPGTGLHMPETIHEQNGDEMGLAVSPSQHGSDDPKPPQSPGSCTSPRTPVRFRSLEDDIMEKETAELPSLRKKGSRGSLFGSLAEEMGIPRDQVEGNVPENKTEDVVGLGVSHHLLSHTASVSASPSISSIDPRKSEYEDDDEESVSARSDSSLTSKQRRRRSNITGDRRSRRGRNGSGSVGERRMKGGASPLPSSTQIYLRTLHTLAISIHARLGAADTVSMNRRLRRAFDLAELTRLSQSVISNISSDIQTLTSRFPPPTPRNANTDPEADAAGSIVYPIVALVQGLLADIAILRSTLNDLSLAYYERLSQKAVQEGEQAMAKVDHLSPAKDAGSSKRQKSVDFTSAAGSFGKAAGSAFLSAFSPSPQPSTSLPAGKEETRTRSASASMTFPIFSGISALVAASSASPEISPSEIEAIPPPDSEDAPPLPPGSQRRPPKTASAVSTLSKSKSVGDLLGSAPNADENTSGSPSAPSAWQAWTGWNWTPKRSGEEGKKEPAEDSATASPAWKPLSFPSLFSTASHSAAEVASPKPHGPPVPHSPIASPITKTKSTAAPPRSSLTTASAIRTRMSLGKGGKHEGENEFGEDESSKPNVPASTLSSPPVPMPIPSATLPMARSGSLNSPRSASSSSKRSRPALSSVVWNAPEAGPDTLPPPPTMTSKSSSSGASSIASSAASSTLVSAPIGNLPRGTWAKGGTVHAEDVWRWIAGYGGTLPHGMEGRRVGIREERVKDDDGMKDGKE
ncbi:hypothetical protein HDU97_008346 [Phlyctochytrium planicorne]|nr:hypothetical protein HDU97_008346 [Phlyctochytrium planicorne]